MWEWADGECREQTRQYVKEMELESRREAEKPERIVNHMHELAWLAGEGDEHAREELTSDAQCAGVPDTTIRAGDWVAVANLVAAHVRELYATAAPAPTP